MCPVAQAPMRHIDPKTEPLKEVHQLMIGGISPRPIAFVSTLSKDGIRNLAPFSFFNAFGANPPMIAFSPARSGRTGEFKDTYHNLVATGECTVQLVSYDIVEQMNLASAAVGPEVDEFKLSGLTPLESDLVKPPRVAESPYQMECKLQQMIHLGEGKASGCMALCEIVRFHVSESIFGEDNRIDPHKLDVVGRNGKMYYTRASGAAMFAVATPPADAIGWDGLPQQVRQSEVFTGNMLARLANAKALPTEEEIAHARNGHPSLAPREYHELAAKALAEGDVASAWALALA